VYSIEKITTCIHDKITKTNESQFSTKFLWIYFVADLLMRHGFCHIDLIGKGWRTWQSNQIAPTHLRFVANLSQNDLNYINPGFKSSWNVTYMLYDIPKFTYLMNKMYVYLGNDHSKHEQVFTHKLHPRAYIVTIHWASELILIVMPWIHT
jgi:hypothetical protein